MKQILEILGIVCLVAAFYTSIVGFITKADPNGILGDITLALIIVGFSCLIITLLFYLKS